MKNGLSETKKAVSVRARKLIKARIDGKTLQEAGEIAGYSKQSAQQQACELLKKPEVKATFAEILSAAGLTDEHLAKRINELSIAKEKKFFAHKGIVIEEREVEALGTQAEMIQFATRLKGHLVDKIQVDDPVSRALEELASKT